MTYELIRQGVDVNTADEAGKTPLYLSSKEGHFDVTHTFLLEGANVNVKEARGLTPLHVCCLNDHFDIARLLLEYGADVNAVDSFGRTPLHIAAQHGQTDIFELLLEHHYSLTLQPHSVETAFDCFPRKNRQELLRIVGEVRRKREEVRLTTMDVLDNFDRCSSRFAPADIGGIVLQFL